MKKVFFAMGLALSLIVPVYAADEAPKTKKVCIDVKDKDGKPEMDKKTGKPKQSCKEVKIHKKHEGTEVPKK